MEQLNPCLFGDDELFLFKVAVVLELMFVDSLLELIFTLELDNVFKPRYKFG